MEVATDTPANVNGTNLVDIYNSLCTNFSLCVNETGFGSIQDKNGSNNGSDNATSPPGLPHPLWLTIILGTAATIVIIVTVLGNILVLLSFVLERTIRQPTNYFIASLAMSDLLIGTFSMPCFTLYLLLGYWPLGELVCDLWLSLDWTVCLASQYTVFFITADRFCSVKIPAKYRNWRTDRKVRVMIALSWTIPSLVFFTSIVGWQYFVGKRTVPEYSCEAQFMSDPLFTFLLTIGYYWTTLIVMVILYVGIYRVALKLQNKSNEKQKKMNNAMELSRNKSKSGGAKNKESKKRTENNNARSLRGADETNARTPTFCKNSENEYSKQSEDDRSSSLAFASDEEDSSGEKVAKKEDCYVNSAVNTETTLKGLLGSSVNHMSKLTFSLSGTSVSTSRVSQSSSDEHSHQHYDHEQIKPLLSDFKPIKEIPQESPVAANKELHNDANDQNQPAVPISETNNIIDGLRYIDEESLKSLASADNVKLLAEIKEVQIAPLTRKELDSPVWRKRIIEDDKSLLVPQSYESGSSEALTSSVIETTCVSKMHDHSDSYIQSDASKHVNKHRKDESKKTKHSAHNHSHAKKSNEKTHYVSSPLQSLVNSLRPNLHKASKKKTVKSKSENRARKALRTISIILGAYVLCWTPYHIMVFIVGICGGLTCINLQFYYFTYWLCYLNSPINPFCYASANAQFKRTFIRILKLDLHRT